MYILGISCHYHDASATLLKDGVIIAAADQERFTRVKHDSAFPKEAIEFVLHYAGISIAEVDKVAFYEKPIKKLDRVLQQYIITFPRSLKVFLQSTPVVLSEKIRILNVIKKELKYKGDVAFIDHHMSHAASAFFPSPFSEAAIYTVDGVGEWATTTYGYGDANRINLHGQISFPHSLGLLYSTITALLGFSVNNSEYKVMGLSAYGEKDKHINQYYPLLLKTIDVKTDGSFRLDMQYFKYDYSGKMPSAKLEELLTIKTRKPTEPVTNAHQDLAAALQLITEEVVLAGLNYLYQVTGSENLVMAGGVALNSVLNGKILSSTPFKRLWIQPNAGDGGGSMGAALAVYYEVTKQQRDPKQYLKHAYLGPEQSDSKIEQYLQTNAISYSKFTDSTELLSTTAKLLHQNKVVGWFQGRMEWGPRALGARSILANPCNPDAQELLNTKVKHREKFRPFAPVICRERVADYFEADQELPLAADFMLMVYPIKQKWHKLIPAVTHVDGSGRLQTIAREQNPLYYDLLVEFEKLSQVPILINTSFNIRGEPIVCTVHDAYKCLMGTEIDYLVAGNYLIARDQNLRDAWNSEVNARD
jgi:carbamoyltransferase